MTQIIKNPPPTLAEVSQFQREASFVIPEEVLTFYARSNGGEIVGPKFLYIMLWPLTDLIELNKDYSLERTFFYRKIDGVYKAVSNPFNLSK